jgi:hypothetical protein
MRTIVTALIVGASLSGVAQGTFQNLDFESADPCGHSDRIVCAN